MKNVDYDTFENLELTELNKRLLRESNCGIDYTIQFYLAPIGTVMRAADRIDTAPYRAFIERLDGRVTWLWKDPRLWLTIRFWQRLMSFSDVKFVWLTRGDLQSWVSCNIRRQIIDYAYCKRYNGRINAYDPGVPRG